MNDILSEKDTRTVEDILMRELAVEREKLTLDARLTTDLGADSLTLVEISMALEEHFNLSIPDERWESVKTVGDAYATLAEMSQPRRPTLARPSNE